MVESGGKHYVGGQVQYIDNCDPDKWSKLEVDDVLEKLSIDVSRLEYYYLNPGMRLDDGLVRLFDNLSAVDMAEIGVQKGVVDVYAVEANEFVGSQITQEIDVGGVSRIDDIEKGGESEGGEIEGCESGKGGESEGGEIEKGGEYEGGEIEGCESGKCGESEGGEIEKANANGIDGVLAVVAEDDPAEDPSFIDSDYDLSDHEEDAIMAGQVEGWKKAVEEMVNDHMGDTSDSDHLPSESPSSSSEEEEELDDINGKLMTRRYRKSTDFNDPRWEIGIRFNCKEDFTDLIRHQGVLHGKKLRLKKNDKVRLSRNVKG